MFSIKLLSFMENDPNSIKFYSLKNLNSIRPNCVNVQNAVCIYQGRIVITFYVLEFSIYVVFAAGMFYRNIRHKYLPL